MAEMDSVVYSSIPDGIVQQRSMDGLQCHNTIGYSNCCAGQKYSNRAVTHFSNHAHFLTFYFKHFHSLPSFVFTNKNHVFRFKLINEFWINLYDNNNITQYTTLVLTSYRCRCLSSTWPTPLYSLPI